ASGGLHPCARAYAIGRGRTLTQVLQTRDADVAIVVRLTHKGVARLAAQSGQYKKVSWVTCFFMTLFHIGAVWALFQFTWSGLAVLLVTYYVSLALGIGMSYHRLLTHRSYKTPKIVEYFLTVCGTLALEGGPLFWVAVHRQHHQYSDTDNDPHTPEHGGFWAHMGWIMFGDAMHNDTRLTAKYAPD